MCANFLLSEPCGAVNVPDLYAVTFSVRVISSLSFQGVNKDSYLILETLPTEYDSRVKAMEVDERPTEQYSDVGGLDKQIQEVSHCPQLLMSCLHCWSIKAKGS